MIFRIIKTAVKWPLIFFIVGSISYSCHDKIERIGRGVKMYGVKAEDGFIEKRKALKLKIRYEINDQGNLETYLVSKDSGHPVYARKNGLMLNTPAYNFSNFSELEKISLCQDVIKAKNFKEGSKSAGFIYELFDLLED